MPGLPRLISGIGIFVALLLVIFAVSQIPDLHAEDESRQRPPERTGSSPREGNRPAIAIVLAAVCGLLYFFIAPILRLMWTPAAHERGIVSAGEIRTC